MKDLVLNDRSAERYAELVLPKFALGHVVEIFKPVSRIRRVVAEILQAAPWKLLVPDLMVALSTAAPSGRTRTEAEVCTGLLDRFQRRKHNVVGSVQEVTVSELLSMPSSM
jgi:hypothetical protein